jgi:hypothetical protein
VGALEISELCGTRERITRHRDVVVPEDDQRPVEPSEQLTEPRLPTGMGDKIARHAHELGTTLRNPTYGRGTRAIAT